MATPDFALLAPVPLRHLTSAEQVAAIQPYVAFGSQKYELFRDIEAERGGRPIPVLIYSSHNEETAELGYRVGWKGWLVGSVEDWQSKKNDEAQGRRPASTAKYPQDNASGWAVFWRVAGLQRVPSSEALELRELNNYRSGTNRTNGAPRGPERIEIPFGFDFGQAPEQGGA